MAVPPKENKPVPATKVGPALLATVEVAVPKLAAVVLLPATVVGPKLNGFTAAVDALLEPKAGGGAEVVTGNDPNVSGAGALVVVAGGEYAGGGAAWAAGVELWNEKSAFEGVEKPTALFELSALVVGVDPKLKAGFGNVGTVVALASVEEVGGAPKVNVDVSDTAGFTTSVLVTPVATVEAGVSTDWLLEVAGAPKLKVRFGDAAEGLAGSVGRPRVVDLTTAGVGTVTVEDTVTVDSAGSLNVTEVSGFLGRGAELSVDATEEEEEVEVVVPVDKSFEEEREKGNLPTDDGIGTGPSAFSPMVKGKPPGFLAASSFFEAASASFSFRLVTSL